MLFKISLSNICKSFRDYTIYFFTLMIGVTIFYVFNSMDSQTAFLIVSQNTRDIIELLINMLSGLSVFVAIVLGLLIVFASRFLIKRRNKEFALYLMLGMGKGRISAILLIETIMIGLISLAAGLLVGIGASQFMSAFTASLFEADMTDFRFTVSSEAIWKTAIYFGIMYLAVMLLNSFMIGKSKLIDLIQAGKKSEKLKLKNPILCVVIFLISACGLGYAYYRVGWHSSGLTQNKMGMMILIGSVATLLIFWSVSGMLLRVLMSMKNVYHRSLNAFTFRQLSSKVNTMVVSMTVICLMLFVTICTLVSAFSMRNSLNTNLKKLCPADFEIQLKALDGNEPVDTCELLLKYDSDFLGYFEDYSHFYRYRDETLTVGSFLGEHLDEVLEDFPYLNTDASLDLFRLSDYNALMELYGRETLSLEGDEYILVANFQTSASKYNVMLREGKTITVFGNQLKPKYSEYQDGFIEISSQPINSGIIVIPDHAANEEAKDVDYFIGRYKSGTKEEYAQTESRVTESYKTAFQSLSSGDKEWGYSCNTRTDIAEASIGLGALVIFLGMYLGIVFLISSAAILALRALSDDVDSIPRYAMLRKIGAEESDISKSQFLQTGLFFILPLLLACLHAYFGMRFTMQYILNFFGSEGMAQSIASTAIVMLLIYGGYFLITYFCGKGIIREKK